jgi:hypothetical protein
MVKYKQFKVIIENNEHLKAIRVQLKRLDCRLGLELSAMGGDAPTCVTVWAEGHYDVWSLPVTPTHYRYHNRTLTLLNLTKMQPEDMLETV